MLDCDPFGSINDAYGCSSGDLLLQEVASRIRQAAPDGHCLAFSGSGEFVVVVEGLGDSSAATVAANLMVDAFDAPLDVGGQLIYSSISIGVARSPADGSCPETLLAAAESALREAKRFGRRGACVFDHQLEQRDSAHARALQRLRRAYADSSLKLHYQPKIRLRDGACIGFEALLRLRSPNGIEGPVALIDAAERSGFITRLGEWVFQTAAAQTRSWFQSGVSLPVAVNLSSSHLQDSRFLAFVDSQIALDPQLPRRLQIEVTESAPALDHLAFASVLAHLRKLGFHIQIDDFCTGYSTMEFLSKMPIDAVKIDQSFIAPLPEASVNQKIVRGMILMSHDLGLYVVAEGIETEAQANWLRDQGCDEGQGFFFSRALPPDAAVSFASTCMSRAESDSLPSPAVSGG